MENKTKEELAELVRAQVAVIDGLTLELATRQPAAPAAHPAPSSDAALVEAIRNGIPLEEPVSVAKAMMAHEKARVSLSGGIGPIAAVFLVNIQVQPWTHTAESASVYADGFNRGVEWLRSSILQHAAHPANGAQAGDTPEWQLIDGAPKDGRTLLLGCFNSMGHWRTMRGQWFSQAAIDDEWEDPDGAEAGWYETAVEPDVPNCWSIKPTHWQPLPAAPQTKKG